MSLFDEHIALVEAVNHAKTQAEWDRAYWILVGWRKGLMALDYQPDLIGCDLYYLNQGIHRPMCCGVWQDWTPEVEANKEQS